MLDPDGGGLRSAERIDDDRYLHNAGGVPAQQFRRVRHRRPCRPARGLVDVPRDVDEPEPGGGFFFLPKDLSEAGRDVGESFHGEARIECERRAEREAGERVVAACERDDPAQHQRVLALLGGRVSGRVERRGEQHVGAVQAAGGDQCPRVTDQARRCRLGAERQRRPEQRHEAEPRRDAHHATGCFSLSRKSLRTFATFGAITALQ